MGPPSSSLPLSFLKQETAQTQASKVFTSYTNMVSRVQGGWRHRGGAFSMRTDAAARFSLVAK
jgi:hypothetical protein